MKILSQWKILIEGTRYAQEPRASLQNRNSYFLDFLLFKAAENRAHVNHAIGIELLQPQELSHIFFSITVRVKAYNRMMIAINRLLEETLE